MAGTAYDYDLHIITSSRWLLTGGDVYQPATEELQHLGEYPAATFAPNGDIFAGTNDGVVKRLCARR